MFILDSRHTQMKITKNWQVCCQKISNFDIVDGIVFLPPKTDFIPFRLNHVQNFNEN